MELKDFVGKTVISAKTGKHYQIEEISAAYIGVVALEPNTSGYPSHYCYETGTVDNAISKGTLLFEDAGLKEPFLKAYCDHCRGEDGRWESYVYWLQKE